MSSVNNSRDDTNEAKLAANQHATTIINGNHQLETISSSFADAPGAMNYNANNMNSASNLSDVAVTSTGFDKFSRSDDDVSTDQQALFAARLFGDGILVRKIKRNGTTHTRTVRCIHVLIDASFASTVPVVASGGSSPASSSRNTPSPASSTTSSMSHSYSKSKGQPWRPVPANTPSSIMALSWSKTSSQQRLRRKSPSDDGLVPLSAFAFIRLGKTTDRAHKNTAPPNLILSLQTNQSRDEMNHLGVTWPPSLDIEAPTVGDRDSLAKAFSEFLRIPIISKDQPPQSEECGDDGLVGPRRRSLGSSDVHSSSGKPPAPPQRESNNSASGQSRSRKGSVEHAAQKLPPQHDNSSDALGSGSYPPPLPPSHQQQPSLPAASSYNSASTRPNTSSQGVVISVVDGGQDGNKSGGSASDMSTITGHGFDQELVEELHQALNEMRSELEESRVEAARAVKVAEQAIQSAERSTSVEWQNTVTHKAAEAAAQAQKRSAEAMAKQRIAEERLEQEKLNAAFWKKQAEIAEEEAGALQTRAAAAEIQRATIEQRLEGESRKSAALQDLLQKRLSLSEGIQRSALQASLERNRILEMEAEQLRRQLDKHLENTENGEEKVPSRRRLSFSRKQKATPESRVSLLSGKTSSSSSQNHANSSVTLNNSMQIAKIAEEASFIREQFELLRRMTSDELGQIPVDSQQWSEQMKAALCFARGESDRLRNNLAYESASRRLLQHEVADLRGTIRVFCQPRPSSADEVSLLSIQSHETVTLHRERIPTSVNDETIGTLSFQFDRVFSASATSTDVYQEIEEVALGVFEGYNVCIMGYGPSNYAAESLYGDLRYKDGTVCIESQGVQSLAIEKLFNVTEHRRDRYRDSFSLSIVEVYNERIADLLAATKKGEECGETIVADGGGRKKKNAADDDTSKGPTKLEIRTNAHGEVVVQGSLSVKVNDFDDTSEVWKESMRNRRTRLLEQGIDFKEYEASSQIIATLKVKSINVATGLGSLGKIQFVNLAGADVVARQTSTVDSKAEPSLQELTQSLSGAAKDVSWRFENRWASVFGEVIVARSQYSRTVPYRNSTLTHLLSDCLDHDAKVVLLACVSSDVKDAQQTATTMRLATQARRIWLGKATKHTLEEPLNK